MAKTKTTCRNCYRPLDNTEDLPGFCDQQCMNSYYNRDVPCPHGNPVTDCQHCYADADFAYDSHREG